MASLRAYVRGLLKTRTDPGEILGLLNNALTEDALDGHFATLLLARLDSGTGSIVYSSAGHSPGFILSASGEVKSVLESTGIPLAIEPDAVFPGVTVPALEPGDLLLLMTDGIIEAHGPEGELFGMDRVLELARQHQQLPAGQILEKLFASLDDYCGSLPAADDMTAIVIKAAPMAGATSSTDSQIVDGTAAIDGVALATPCAI
jgi:serine phosphatase RsbU (regulator of sigma subunit)